MPMFRLKIGEVEAKRWDGRLPYREWLGYAFVEITADGELVIENRDGRVVARPGDWIVHLDTGFYPVEPIKFHAAYEAAS